MQEKSEEEDVFLKLWHQAMAEVDYLASKLASAACCDEENLVQEKKEQYREVYLMNEKQDQVGVSLSMQGAEQDPYLMQVVVPEVSGKKAEAETMEEEKVTRIEKFQLDKVEMNWCGEVPLLINRQESVSLSKQGSYPDVLQGEGSEVTDVKKEAEEEFKKCDNSFPHEPGADSEQSKIKEMDPWAHWTRRRRFGAAECFPRLSKKAEEAQAQTSSKKEMEMDLEVDKLVNYAEAAEQPIFKELMLRQHNLNTKDVEKHADAKQLYIMRAETDEVGEVVKMLGNATQMKMSSKLLIEEVGEVVTKANPEAREKFNKCENSFPYEPGADSEQSKIKEVKEIDPSAHWIRWRKCGAAECFPRLSKKAEMAEAQTSSKEEKTKSSHPEMKVDEVLYTAEQRRLLAEVEARGEEDAEPGPHVEQVPASKELLAEVEAWGHVDAEADIFERSESKQEAEVKLAAHTTKAEAVERSLPRLEKGDSNSMIDKLAENSASNQLEEEKKMSNEETDLKADMLLAPEWMESKSKADKVENSAEAAEQPDFKELMLRQHNLNTKEVEKHVDAKQPNYIVKVETEARENRMHLKEAKQSLKVEEDWQGSALLVFDKQDLVGVSLTKKVEIKLMHVLKAEAVWVRNKKQKLMKEELLEYCKQYLDVEECENEGRGALPVFLILHPGSFL